MFLFVPLGDIRERRGLIVTMLTAVTVSLMCVAAAQTLSWMYFASLVLGFTTVIPQLIVPLAAQMAPPADRGKIIGTVMSGLLTGVLLARTVAGAVGELWGWRAMYWIAASMMLALAAVLLRVLPKSYPQSNLTYGQLFKSMAELVRTQPTVREASLIGFMMFGSFSVFWTSLSFFIEGSPYYYGSGIAGLFGLVGVFGAAAAPLAGRMADRFGATGIVGFFIACTLVSYLLFGFAGYYLWGLILGVILVDLGVQGSQVSNQTRIYALIPDARGRLNTIFMVSTFFGGAVGSALGSYAWSTGQWYGVCVVGGGMVLAAALVWVCHRMNTQAG
ncbi:MFS transporter [Paenibacillus xerothermodurans]|uniref:MFS transporter n=1 Tax=Paenibacillus xerothermodurans TaxID=1977292 RepID=UPI001A9D4CDD|nr:MFS transporter [Paenibacillus xerothermodurans]